MHDCLYIIRWKWWKFRFINDRWERLNLGGNKTTSSHVLSSSACISTNFSIFIYRAVGAFSFRGSGGTRTWNLFRYLRPVSDFSQPRGKFINHFRSFHYFPNLSQLLYFSPSQTLSVTSSHISINGSRFSHGGVAASKKIPVNLYPTCYWTFFQKKEFEPIKKLCSFSNCSGKKIKRTAIGVIRSNFDPPLPHPGERGQSEDKDGKLRG